MPFHKRRRELGEYSADGDDQAGFGVVWGHVGDVLDVWPNEVVQQVQVGGRRGPVREGYKVVALLLKPCLGLFGLVGRRRVLIHTQGLPPTTLLHQGITTLFSTSRYTLVLTFKPTSKIWGGMMWPSLETTPKTIIVAVRRVVRCVELCPPDLYFEGAGDGPVVITWIGREHELYSGASQISFVEHCVTFRHDRRLLSLLGFRHNWPTSRWSATKKRKPVFLKRKWNHVVFSRATILSFHLVITVLSNYFNWRHHFWELFLYEKIRHSKMFFLWSCAFFGIFCGSVCAFYNFCTGIRPENDISSCRFIFISLVFLVAIFCIWLFYGFLHCVFFFFGWIL